MKITEIKVEISDIEVDEYYYSFNYTISVDGDIVDSDTYESDHAWYDDINGFKELLESGQAVKTALEQWVI